MSLKTANDLKKAYMRIDNVFNKSNPGQFKTWIKDTFNVNVSGTKQMMKGQIKGTLEKQIGYEINS